LLTDLNHLLRDGSWVSACPPPCLVHQPVCSYLRWLLLVSCLWLLNCKSYVCASTIFFCYTLVVFCI